MYTQFFGNYLLEKNIITTEQLLNALKEQSKVHLKLGTLAMHEGYMTANEVDTIVIMQTHEDKKFGELAIEEGYLTQEQVEALLEAQKPDYLLLGQVLIEQGILTNVQFENIIVEYQSENELYDTDFSDFQKKKFDEMLSSIGNFSDKQQEERLAEYLQLLITNLIRFIGNDFTILSPMPCNEYPSVYCVKQLIQGNFVIESYLDTNETTAVEFASRYANDTFTEFDEYVKASLEDFLNLHNGLFNVNMSNAYSYELMLTPPEVLTYQVIPFEKEHFILPVIYPFGTINFVFSITTE